MCVFVMPSALRKLVSIQDGKQTEVRRNTELYAPRFCDEFAAAASCGQLTLECGEMCHEQSIG